MIRGLIIIAIVKTDIREIIDKVIMISFEIAKREPKRKCSKSRFDPEIEIIRTPRAILIR